MNYQTIGLLGYILVSVVMLFVTQPLRAADYSARVTVKKPLGQKSCPRLYRFTGIIRANRTGRVQYRWLRSDNANSPIQTLNFARPGSQTVATSWKLGAAGRNYQGWQQIEILYPQRSKSNQARFLLKCPAKSVVVPNLPAHGSATPPLNSAACRRLKAEIDTLAAQINRILSNPALNHSEKLRRAAPLQIQLNRKLQQYDRQCKRSTGPIRLPERVRGNLGNTRTDTIPGATRGISPLPDLKIVAVQPQINRMKLLVVIKNVGLGASSKTTVRMNCWKTYLEPWGQSACFGHSRSGSLTELTTDVPAIAAGRSTNVFINLNRYVTVSRRYFYNGKFEFDVQVNSRAYSVRSFTPGPLKESSYANNTKRASAMVGFFSPVPKITRVSTTSPCVPLGGIVVVSGSNLGPWPRLGSGNGIQVRAPTHYTGNQILTWNNSGFRFRIANNPALRGKQAYITLLNLPGNYFIGNGTRFNICR